MKFEENQMHQGVAIITPRASRNQRSLPPTQEAVAPFVVIQEPSPIVSSSPAPIRLFVDGLLWKAKLVVATIMVTFSLCMLVLIVVIWPVLVSSTNAVMSCNPQLQITAGCPHLEPRYVEPNK